MSTYRDLEFQEYTASPRMHHRRARYSVHQGEDREADIIHKLYP